MRSIQNPDESQARKAASLRRQFVEAVVSDGEFSASEQQSCMEAARFCKDASFTNLVTKWQKLREGNLVRGFTASELRKITGNDYKMARAWAAAARDQMRFVQYFEKNFGQPLMFSIDEANRLLDDLSRLYPLDQESRAEEYFRLVTALSSDLFDGRGSGTPGCEKACRYLCDELHDTLPGLTIRMQPVVIPRHVSFDPDKNWLQVNETVIRWNALNEAICPVIFSQAQSEVSAKTLAVKSVSELREKNLQARDKIIIFKPAEEDFDLSSKAAFDTLTASQEAFTLGAVGVIIFADTYQPEYVSWPDLFPDDRGGYPNNLSLYWAHPPNRRHALMATATLPGKGFPLQLPGPVILAFPEIIAVLAPQANLDALASETVLTLKTSIQWQLAESHNILATPANLPVDMTLLSAHYDHLGREEFPYQAEHGLDPASFEAMKETMDELDQARLEKRPLFSRGMPEPSSAFPNTPLKQYEKSLERYGFIHDPIYNGAVDNASSCALLLLLARELQDKIPLSLVFFTGEEQGLLGSKILAQQWNHVFPGRCLKLMINLEMAGARDPDLPATIFYQLHGASAEDYAIHLKRIYQPMGLPYLLETNGYEGRLGHSDQESFGDFPDITTVYLSGGFYPQYHAPGDERKSVDFDKGLAIGKVITRLLQDQ